MRRSKAMIVSGIVALLLFAAESQAQQDGVNRNRLMFDPAGLQSSRGGATSLQPSPTVGQSTTSREATTAARPTAAVPPPPAPPAARHTAAPQQSAAPAPKPAAANPKPAARTATTPPRPANTRRPPASENAANGAGAARSSDRPIPREQPASLGRVDLPSGSMGFENRTALRDYDMSDGGKVPVFDNIQRNESSYFGLSIRMPTPSSSPSWMREHGAN